MSANEDVVRRKSSAQVPLLTEQALLATILILFLLLHVMAGAMMQRAGATDRAPSTHDIAAQLYD